MPDILSNLNIENFYYTLPEEKIAKYPLEQRDQSQLLVYRNGRITDDIFMNLSNYLPKNNLLIYNETRVIQARLVFRKPTGSEIEIFCLEPLIPADYALMFLQKKPVIWKCLVGNIKKWKEVFLYLAIDNGNDKIVLKATKIANHGTWHEIQFDWEPQTISFAEVLELTGHTPIPPYLKRDSEDLDKMRYQTIYSQFNGSVAAPTAGLHFTPSLFEKLENNGFQYIGITLHVGAGTFKPVITEKISEHEMHSETFFINRNVISHLITMASKIIAVGTTTLRALESLYWSGIKLKEGLSEPFFINQWEWTRLPGKYSLIESMTAIERYMNKNNISEIKARTAIMITPGYDFKMIDKLITNFHQPKSTLLLLIAAFVGNDWKKIYNHALNNDYRFLSYGDGSLLYKIS
jgi:S-adenosylmethionine:tRNA ribosyltransferase-isomerase